MQRYKEDGYTILECVYDEEAMAAWRREADRLEEAHTGVFAQNRSWWFGNMLDHLQARANSGFQEPDEKRWKKWREEDRQALVG